MEVQYRTRVQHAWATALEISDLIDGQRTKFELEDSDRVRFFALASEILARYHEGLSNALTASSTEALCEEFEALEERLGILKRLEALRATGDFDKIRRHNVLNVIHNEFGAIDLEILNFRSPADAIAEASKLESTTTSLNTVYVRADNPAQLKSAYRNYFNDPVDFVRLVKEAVESIKFQQLDS